MHRNRISEAWRKGLKADQRAAIAVDTLPHYEAQAKKRQIRKPANFVTAKMPEQTDKGEARQKVAEEFKVGERYVSDLKKIKSEDPEIFEEIKAGKKRAADESDGKL